MKFCHSFLLVCIHAIFVSRCIAFEECDADEDLLTIESILSKHDTDGKIGEQVLSNLRNDRLNLNAR